MSLSRLLYTVRYYNNSYSDGYDEAVKEKYKMIAQRQPSVGEVSFAPPQLVEDRYGAKQPDVTLEQAPWLLLQGTAEAYNNGDQCDALSTAHRLARMGLNVCMIDPDQVRDLHAQTKKALRGYDLTAPQGLYRRIGSRTLTPTYPQPIRSTMHKVLGAAEDLAAYYAVDGVIALNPSGILDDLTLDVISTVRPYAENSAPKVVFSRPLVPNIKAVKRYLRLFAGNYRVIDPEDTRALSAHLVS